jgi:hypothetical protein
VTGRDLVGMRDGVEETKKNEVDRKSVEDLCRDCWRCGIRFQLRVGLGWVVRREGVTVICRATRNGLSVVANAASRAPSASPSHSHSHSHSSASAHAHSAKVGLPVSAAVLVAVN